MPAADTEDIEPAASWFVEDDPDSWGARDTARRAFYSAAVTLTLSVLGSTILPIPFAMSRTGVLVGGLTMLAVAAANDLTSCWLVRAAAATGRDSYEALAEWAGGKAWKVITQVSLIALLFGTLCGGLALIADVGKLLVDRAAGEQPLPGWLTGRVCMVAVVVLVLGPLCMQRHMRQLEKAATAGVAIVVLLIALLASNAYAAGFPALRNGDLPLWSLRVDEHLPEAFAVFGFAFYMQPMMMPMLQEMPPQGGVAVMEAAVHVTLYVVALLVYFAMGFFGAALYGRSTDGNIMNNDLVAGRGAALALYATMLVYLCFGMATTQLALRASLDPLLYGEGHPCSWSGLAALNTLTLGAAVVVAWNVPRQVEKVYAFVGATAVCVVCYIIPVMIHLRMYTRRRAQRRAAAALQDTDAPLLDPHPAAGGVVAGGGGAAATVRRGGGARRGRRAGGAKSAWLRGAVELLGEVVLPVGVLLLGVGFSCAALWVAAKPFVADL